MVQNNPELHLGVKRALIKARLQMCYEGRKLSSIRAVSMTDEQHRLTVRAPAPDWFHWAIGQQGQSARVMVDGCSIHYLVWQPEDGVTDPDGLLFIHGGGAHAHWWSHIAPFFRASFRVAALDLSGMGD